MARYLETRQNEFDAARFWSRSVEARGVLLALLGVIATFFTWGVAYIFEFIKDMSAVNLAALITFFAGSGAAILLYRLRNILRNKLPRVKRSEISRIVTIEYNPKQVWSDYFGDESEGEDAYGANIKLADYGDESSQYGWIVEHVKPQSEGGSDDYSNLRPVNIRASRSQGD